jgi:hypothetical protein
MLDTVAVVVAILIVNLKIPTSLPFALTENLNNGWSPLAKADGCHPVTAAKLG